jgi:hypothetical protein
MNMLPDREGVYHAYPTSIGIDEIGDHRLATCVIAFSLFEELVDGEWRNCEDEELEITGWFFLEKKDGSVNTMTVDALKAAFGWDGRDPFWLQDTDLSRKAVQVKLGFEEYGGKNRIKVQFINPYGSAPSGGVTKGGDDVRRSVGARLGSKLRALAGGAPAPAPKPVGRPLPPAKPAAAKPDPKDSGATATMDQAWAAFTAACPADWTDKEIEYEWCNVLRRLCPGKKIEDLSAHDWAVVAREAPSGIAPF